MNAPVIWMTGLPGAGKTTIANRVKKLLEEDGKRAEILDGDEVRKTLSPDLGFSKEERTLHNKRVIHLAKLLSRNDVVVLVSLISPYREVREYARSELSPHFREVFVKCPLEVCIERDPKGLYQKAKEGIVKKMTGLNDTYEEPLSPDLIVETNSESEEESARKVLGIVGEL